LLSALEERNPLAFWEDKPEAGNSVDHKKR
jgi:hypothetical protein